MLGVALEHVIVATHPRVVIDVSGTRHADDRVQQEVRLGLVSRAHRELLVRAVHRIAGLKGDHAPPAELAEALAQLARRVAQVPEIVVRGRGHAAQRPADVHRMRTIQGVDPRMRSVLGAVDALRLDAPVRGPDVLHFVHGDQHALRIPQRDLHARRDALGKALADVERDRDRPQRAVSHAQVRDHAVVVAARHETAERRERAVEEQLDVAQLPRGQVPGRPVARLRLDRRRERIDEIELPELAAVGCDEIGQNGMSSSNSSEPPPAAPLPLERGASSPRERSGRDSPPMPPPAPAPPPRPSSICISLAMTSVL